VEQLPSQCATRQSDAEARLRFGGKQLHWGVPTGTALIGLLAFLPALLAQKVTEGTKVEFAEHYDPPHEQQIKWHIQGAKAEPLDREGQRLLITDARSETYRETGEGELIVEAPQAIFERSQRSISSAGPIHVQTADRSFSIEGEGFLWLQSTSTLFISNRVHTVVLPGLANSHDAPPRPVDKPDTNQIDVFSRQFQFQADTGEGNYEGDIRVTGEKLNLTSERLTVLLPSQQRRLENVTALTNVVIDYQLDHEAVHATGERAEYSVASGLVRITGNPTWSAQEREGRGDELVLDRTNNTFQANGHAFLKLPAEGFKDSGFLPADAKIETNHYVEITSSNYVFQTNLAVFNDDVHVTETTNGQPRGTMTCARITGRFAGTNQLETLLAETNVVFRQEDNLFTGQQALFTATNGALEMTGEPAWQAGKREGKGDRLLAFLRQKEMQALGHAWMRLPATELGQSMPATTERPKPAPRTQKAPPDPRFAPLEIEVEPPRRPSTRLFDTSPSRSTGEQFAEIFSRDYSVLPDSARFMGGVRIVHPQMDWTCEQMNVKTEAGGGKNVNMLAEHQVAFVLNDAKGDTLRGACEQAVYEYKVTPTMTNDVLKMTGNPVLETTNGTLRNPIIMLDRAHNKLVAPGPYVLRGTTPGGTNAPALPNFKSLK
jgi:lipopolysaccharide transport protein LptA